MILSRWQRLSISGQWWTELQKESKSCNLKFCLGSDAKRQKLRELCRKLLVNNV